jgi:purine nucleoside permease
VMTNNEDSGTLTALTRLSKLERVDIRRVLVLRAGSNYDMQAPGQTAGESSSGTSGGGGGVVFESLHRVGSTVLHELLKNWSKWERTIPGSER